MSNLKKIFKTAEYRKWELTLDAVASSTVAARIKNLQVGKKGDWASVGEGVYELRFLRSGPGWRVYFHETNAGMFILLLVGGDKSSQRQDIKEAKRILQALKLAQAKRKKEQRDAPSGKSAGTPSKGAIKK